MAALLANPKGVLRLNATLVLLALLVVQALMVSIHSEFLLGSSFRAASFLGFVATLDDPIDDAKLPGLISSHEVITIEIPGK